MQNVLSIVLGGGKGTRLYPLTKKRAKPAVPFGGKYRLVDIPISNCINSNMKQIYILTQFNSASLHMHLSQTYIFDNFSGGFVEILAAEQTFEHSGWYEGTADAVRKNFTHFHTQKPDYYVILSGDQLYRMDLADFLMRHTDESADITIAVTPVNREEASSLGILKTDNQGRVTEFLEKPGPERDISDFKIPDSLRSEVTNIDPSREYLASMGIYIFNAKAIEKSLDNNEPDFGKQIIPMAINTMKVGSYIFTGYWEDIGTIKSFYEENLNLASIHPKFNFYDEKAPIYTHKRYLPASKFNFCTMSETLTAEGCLITNASINRSLIGIRTFIETGANLDGVVCMGADYYETPEERNQNTESAIPNIGIGKGTIIKQAIIDKNARIGEKCRIGIDDLERNEGDYGNYHIVDGIVVIPKNSVIPSGTVI